MTRLTMLAHLAWVAGCTNHGPSPKHDDTGAARGSASTAVPTPERLCGEAATCDCSHVSPIIRHEGDLWSLEGCTALGQLNIVSTEIESLAALHALETTESNLNIGGNRLLVSLAGLEGLGVVGGGLSIELNDSLESAAALAAVHTVGDLTLIGNDRLRSDVGLTALATVGGDLALLATPMEDLARLRSLESVGGSIIIAENPQLGSMHGIETLSRIGGGLLVQDNPTLVELHVPSAGLGVGGGVTISGSPELCGSDALEWLERVDVDGDVALDGLGGC